ncbi:MAG: hypothetical protein J3Q66DRAFT_98524 [Benniella sp.]|nr:MAG: hypothetical protein J3Q66DRAFT_98524 [Benniella sp.]
MNQEDYSHLITEETRRQFHRDGFVIVKNVLEFQELEVFRREVDCLMNFLISENVDIMKDFGGVIEPISCGYIEPPVSQMYIMSKRSYSSLRNMVTESPDTVVPVLFGKMPALAQRLLPTEPDDNPLCLFNEQYIVKTPNSSSVSSFPWHFDSQYMDASAQTAFPIVSCWTALDDVNVKNGTLLIEPFPRPIDPRSGECFDPPTSMDDLATYLSYHKGVVSNYGPELDRDDALAQARLSSFNTTPAISNIARPLDIPSSKKDSWMASVIFERQRPVLVDIPAGSIVFISGFVKHCSLGNESLRFRRAYMPQFSAGKVVGEGECIVSLAVPCSDLYQHQD